MTSLSSRRAVARHRVRMRAVGLLLAILLGVSLGMTRQAVRTPYPVAPRVRAWEWNDDARGPERETPPVYLHRYTPDLDRAIEKYQTPPSGERGWGHDEWGDEFEVRRVRNARFLPRDAAKVSLLYACNVLWKNTALFFMQPSIYCS